MVGKKKTNREKITDGYDLYKKANEHWSAGRLRPAFQMFLAAADAGVVKAFFIIASFYEYGEGVKANEETALYWYRRAAREAGNYSAANNIGCIWRERGNLRRALWWLNKAVEMGDCEANLNIANIYLNYKHDSKAAAPYLRKVAKSRSKYVSEGGKEEAATLLKQISKEKVKSRNFRK